MALFLSLGLVLFGLFVTTPRLIVLLLFANDFVTMAIATDRVSFSQTPEHWSIRPLVMSALSLALILLVLSLGLLWVLRDALHLNLSQMQTLVFVWLVFSGQATVYLVRERHHFWEAAPSRWLAFASLADVPRRQLSRHTRLADDAGCGAIGIAPPKDLTGIPGHSGPLQDRGLPALPAVVTIAPSPEVCHIRQFHRRQITLKIHRHLAMKMTGRAAPAAS